MVESVFLNVSAALTLTDSLAREIFSFFTKSLRSALEFTCKYHMDNKNVYVKVLKAIDTVKQRAH